jgi:hypothetical protein
MASIDAANGLLAKHYGVAVDRKEITVRTIDPSTLSEEELTQAISQLERMVDGEYTVIETDAPVRQIARRLARPSA